MTDWDEVGVEHWIENGLITYDASGNLMFPTIEQCLRFSELSYVQKGLERFQSNLGVNFGSAIAGVRVLPIKSDPTRKDSDEDGYSDYDEIIKNNTNPLKSNQEATITTPAADDVSITMIGRARDTTNNIVREIWLIKKENNPNFNSLVNEYNTNEDFKNALLIIDGTNSYEINYQVYNSYLYNDYTIIMDTIRVIQEYNNKLNRTEWERTTDGLYYEWLEHNFLYLIPDEKIKSSAQHADLDQYARGTIFGPDLFNYYEQR